MRNAWRNWRRRRQMIREWNAYYRAIFNESYAESLGLGHPEWIERPTFADPRDRLADLRN